MVGLVMDGHIIYGLTPWIGKIRYSEVNIKFYKLRFHDFKIKCLYNMHGILGGYIILLYYGMHPSWKSACKEGEHLSNTL